MRQVASMSFTVRAEECSDGTMIYVSISTSPGTEWMGTEEQFRQMFTVSGRDRKTEVNNLAVVLQSVWEKALKRNLKSENPGLLIPAILKFSSSTTK